MRKVILTLFLISASLLSACSKEEKVEVKMEKKNPVKEVIEKQLKEVEKEKTEDGLEKPSLVIESTEDEKKPKKEEEPKKDSEKKSEEEVVDEQVKKLTEKEKELKKKEREKNPDYNPTEEVQVGEGEDNNFVSQFGENEFNEMIDEARHVKKKGEFDYDLTDMDGDMVYATVYLMMTDPDSFIGKKFKMRGQYYAAFYEPTKAYYHYCFISDAAGCCEQGIEFAVDSKFKYPDDFPEDAANILVTGVFEKYTEDDKIFVRLKNAVMKVE